MALTGRLPRDSHVPLQFTKIALRGSYGTALRQDVTAALKALSKIVEAPLKKLLNFDVCVV